MKQSFYHDFYLDDVAYLRTLTRELVYWNRRLKDKTRPIDPTIEDFIRNFNHSIWLEIKEVEQSATRNRKMNREILQSAPR